MRGSFREEPVVDLHIIIQIQDSSFWFCRFRIGIRWGGVTGTGQERCRLNGIGRPRGSFVRRHVDEIERRVRGKPLRSSTTSAIDGPLTRKVKNRLYLFGLARRSLENFRTRHAPGLLSIFSALTVHFTMLPPFFSAVFGDISSLRLQSLVSIRPVLLLSQLIR